VAGVEIVRDDSYPEIGKLRKSWRLLSKVAPESRGILGNNNFKLVSARRGQKFLVTGPLSRPPADRPIGESRHNREAVPLSETLGHPKLVRDRLLTLQVCAVAGINGGFHRGFLLVLGAVRATSAFSIAP
jgi:hypothetical protein